MALLKENGEYVKISHVVIDSFDNTQTVVLHIYENTEEREKHKESPNNKFVRYIETSVPRIIINENEQGVNLKDSILKNGYKVLKEKIVKERETDENGNVISEKLEDTEYSKATDC